MRSFGASFQKCILKNCARTSYSLPNFYSGQVWPKETSSQLHSVFSNIKHSFRELSHFDPSHVTIIHLCWPPKGKKTRPDFLTCQSKCVKRLVSGRHCEKIFDEHLRGAWSHSHRLKINFFSEVLCWSVTTDAFQGSLTPVLGRLLTLTCPPIKRLRCTVRAAWISALWVSLVFFTCVVFSS